MFLIPLLTAFQFLAAGLTIWGFFNTPGVADTVVTYGASGPDSPDMTDWMSSAGSIVFGLGTFAASWFAQHKLGGKSELYMAVMALIANPTNAQNLMRATLAIISVLEQKWSSDPEDIKALEFIKQWLVTKTVAEPLPNALK